MEGTSFVGRRQELREVKRLLTTTRLLTLTGSGGAGKTRLPLRRPEHSGRAGEPGLRFMRYHPSRSEQTHLASATPRPSAPVIEFSSTTSPSAHWTSALARLVAPELSERGWKLEAATTDNASEFRADENNRTLA